MQQLISAFFILWLSSSAIASELEDEKRRAIDEFVELSGASKAGVLMADQAMRMMFDAYASNDDVIDEREAEIIKEEMIAFFRDEIIENGFMNDVTYAVYTRHFTLAELKDIVAFYKTPTGKRFSVLAPQLTQEGMIEAQKRMEKVMDKGLDRVDKRLREEGFR